MGGVLIVAGIILSYLCWITKKEYEYIGNKSIENGGSSLDEKNINIQKKLKDNQKLTIIERVQYWNYHAKNIAYRLLGIGIYFGLALSFLGFILLIINSN